MTAAKLTMASVRWRAARIATLWLMLGVLLVVPAAAQAPQTPPPRKAPQAERTIRVGVDLVLVNATVMENDGRLVTGLERENFRIFEDGVEQEVLHLATEHVPISAGVILDISGSMEGQIDHARQVALRFFKNANPQDEFFLVHFNNRAQLVSTFTRSVDELRDKLLYTRASGRTALLDAVYLGLAHIKKARNSRRVIIVISDGGDNHSRYNEKDVEQLAKETDVQFYGIGYFDYTGLGVMKRLVQMTGGRFFPMDLLSGVADYIWNELREQYILAYKPSHRARDGKWHKVKVQLRPPKGLPPLRVYARTGYLAPSQ